MKTTEERVIACINDSLNGQAKDIHRETQFADDLGFDSLDQVEIGMRVEEEFGLEIPDDKIADFVVVGDLIDFVEETTAKKAA